jgi:hypothetical protein
VAFYAVSKIIFCPVLNIPLQKASRGLIYMELLLVPHDRDGSPLRNSLHCYVALVSASTVVRRGGTVHTFCISIFHTGYVGRSDLLINTTKGQLYN